MNKNALEARLSRTRDDKSPPRSRRPARLVAALTSAGLVALGIGVAPGAFAQLTVEQLQPTVKMFDPVPQGWQNMGNGGPMQQPGRCRKGVDRVMTEGGQRNMTIYCPGPRPSFGGLRQSFEASPYQGKRVRFSAWLMADGIDDVDDVEGGGGLWIAVPTPDGPRMNRMPDVALRGTTSWEYRDIVVDVPEGGGPWLVIGFWMQGRGQIWIRDLQFEEVSKSVPVNFVISQDPVIGPNLGLE